MVEGSRNLCLGLLAWSGWHGELLTCTRGLMKTITAAVIDGDAASVCTELIITSWNEPTPKKLQVVPITLAGTWECTHNRF